MRLCFFFSSRRRHTRWTGDWSSDVCSSDLIPAARLTANQGAKSPGFCGRVARLLSFCSVESNFHRKGRVKRPRTKRSEERRVGKECRWRWAQDQEKKKQRQKRGHAR